MSTHQVKIGPDIPGFEIVRIIGEGGMGRVYLARQESLDRPVAIKFLTSLGGVSTEDFGLRFRREAEVMAKVAHPNIATIFDYGSVDGQPYLVMEYIEGGDLRSRMVPSFPMPLSEFRALIRPVIRAVAHLHRQGIIHRDLKPENILIHHEETPKVTDFGIAVLDHGAGSLTRTGHSLGTLGYVSPEQHYGLRIDERADQYSLAALCYELLTGRKPLGAFLAPDKVNPMVGPSAGLAVMKALSDDPDDRFPTLEGFGEALERGLDRPDAPESSSRSARRIAPVVVVICAGLLVAALGVIAARTPKLDPTRNPVTHPVADADGLSGPDTGAAPPSISARSVRMTLILIPAGSCWIGSEPGDPAALPDERPRHRVRITRPFYLADKEVTVGQFAEFVRSTGHVTSAEREPSQPGASWGGSVYNLRLGRVEPNPGCNWRRPDGQKSAIDDDPVVQVSWVDAVAFCDWLGRVERRTFRLPTEAEWEYACRAGTETRWSSGEDLKALDDHAWTLRNARYAFHAVGSKKPNPFGLHDMHGNVWEWCCDRYGAYPDGPGRRPPGASRGGQPRPPGRLVRLGQGRTHSIGLAFFLSSEHVLL